MPLSYTGRNYLSSVYVTSEGMAYYHYWRESAAVRNRPGHFIREWRLSKNLSLRKLADRLLTDNLEPIISYASLSRIEKGSQPYTQDVLEAIADALGTSPAALLMFDPSRDNGLLTLWDRIPVEERKRAWNVLEQFAKDGTHN